MCLYAFDKLLATHFNVHLWLNGGSRLLFVTLPFQTLVLAA